MSHGSVARSGTPSSSRHNVAWPIVKSSCRICREQYARRSSTAQQALEEVGGGPSEIDGPRKKRTPAGLDTRNRCTVRSVWSAGRRRSARRHELNPLDHGGLDGDGLTKPISRLAFTPRIAVRLPNLVENPKYVHSTSLAPLHLSMPTKVSLTTSATLASASEIGGQPSNYRCIDSRSCPISSSTRGTLSMSAPVPVFRRGRLEYRLGRRRPRDLLAAPATAGRTRFDEVGSRVGHAPAGAARADRACFSRKRRREDRDGGYHTDSA